MASPSGMLCTAIAIVISSAEPGSVAVGDADADALGRRVDGHHRDDHERLPRVGAGEAAEHEPLVLADHRAGRPR